MSLTGMNVAEVRQMADQLRRAADELRHVVSTVDGRVTHSSWDGRDADEFKHEWWPGHRARVLEVADAVQGLAQSARNNADEQERVSSSAGAGGSAGAAAGGSGRPLTPWDVVTAGTGGAIAAFLSRLGRPWSVGPHWSGQRGPEGSRELFRHGNLIAVSGHYKAQVDAYGEAWLHSDGRGVDAQIGGGLHGTASGGLTNHWRLGPVSGTDDLTRQAQVGAEGGVRLHAGEDGYSYDIKMPSAEAEISDVRSESVHLGPLTLDISGGGYAGVEASPVEGIDGLSGGYVDGHFKQHVDFGFPLARFAGIKGGVGFDLDVPQFRNDVDHAAQSVQREASAAWNWFSR